MPDVRLHLIGGFELTVDGELLGEVQPATQRLIAFVALTPRGVERDFAALQLWPDTSEDRARANLRSALWRARRLPVDVLATRSTRLRLADAVWVDARQGMEEATAGGGLGGLESPLPFQSLLADLLPDWYDDWLGIERERMRQLSLGLLDRRARQALAAGDVATALQVALHAVSIDPLRETSNRLVAEAHLTEGNEHDARRTLEDYRQRLASGSGPAPARELEAFVRDRASGPPAAALVAGSSR